MHKKKSINLITQTSLVGIVSLFVFGVVSFFDGRIINAITELLIGALAAINLGLLKIHKNERFAASGVLILMHIILILLVLSGGIAGTGYLWFFTFPPLAFFLFGKRQGWYWIFSSVILVLCIMLLDFAGVTGISSFYSAVELRQLLAAYSAVTLMVYVYEVSIHLDQAEIVKTAQTLAQLNSELHKEISKKNTIQHALDEKLGDISNTKKAILNVLEDLEEEKTKAETILSSIGEGLVATDESGVIILVNDACTELLGFSQEELLHQSMLDILPLSTDEQDNLPAEVRPLTQALQTGEKISISNASYTKKNGELLPVEITVSPIVIDDQIIGSIEIFRDITKEREVDRMKTEFLSLASHQLRTPLTAIKWFLELLLDPDSGSLTVSQQEAAQKATDSTERMIELVNSLLNVSRIETGRIIVDPTPTDLKKLVQEVIDELAVTAKEKEIAVNLTVPETELTLSIDPKLVRQIYLNLISNAIKYSPNQAGVGVALTLTETDLISTITDSGFGIPEADQDQIFSKFFRASNANIQEIDGNGLGLYLTKQIVEISGGAISFESLENQGTTFTFSLPLSGSTQKQGEKSIEE